jgi:hypothetical protein
MPRTIRRIVTGHDKQGKAIVLRDGEIEMQSRWPGTSRANMWLTETTRPSSATKTWPRRSGRRPRR